MNIVICDDDGLAIENTNSMLLATFAKRDVQATIESFTSGRELIQHLRRLKSTDLFLLDYKLQDEEISGMHVAQAIREHGISACIIFISSVVEAAPKGYLVNAFRYVIKDENWEENLVKGLNLVIDEYLTPSQTFSYYVNKQEQTVPAQEIMYFEGQDHKIIMHMDTSAGHPQQYEFYGKLSEVEQRLANFHFIKVYRAYIINLKYVSRLMPRNQHAVLLKDGTEVPISRTKGTEIRKAIMVWLSNHDV